MIGAIDGPAAAVAARPDIAPRLPILIAVGLVAGSVIALQIVVMRVFSVGSWAHFGSLVVSLAMLGFGLASAIMCVAKGWFERHWRGFALATLVLMGPLIAGANLAAQQLPFNAIFLVSDPAQKWRLAANFGLYLLPFLAGAFFLGTIFLKANEAFGRVYCADLTGAGLCGLAVLLAMYGLNPEDLILVPILLWAAGTLFWFWGLGRQAGFGQPASRSLWLAAFAAILVALAIQIPLPNLLGVPRLGVSSYKGVAYARNFPDNRRVYQNISPFGDLQVYASSYLHFAPGLSDNAAFNLPSMPDNAYLGLYVDGEGPSGIIRVLPPTETAYYNYLPMVYPYVVKSAPRTFVVQFGGGISTSVALNSGASHVTVAESNPAVLAAFRNDPGLRDFTGDILHNPRVDVVDYDGRLFLATTPQRFDIIDLSLADSAGLSNPGGFAIVEKYAYTQEAMGHYMQALAEGGILSVTLWNKEEPPKSVLKLYATMAAAARDVVGSKQAIDADFFVASNYLSTTTVLYKRGGFTPDELDTLRAHTHAMSFEEIYYPGFVPTEADTKSVLDNYRAQIFGDAGAAEHAPAAHLDPAATDAGPLAADADPPPDTGLLPSTVLGRLFWNRLVQGPDAAAVLADAYVFDTRALTNNRPYFAAYVKPGDLGRVVDRLELFQDEWGYLLVWATLGLACLAALVLVLVPVLFGWRTIFSRTAGKLGTIVYFACLGLGYIMVEVGLISKFTLALSNATVSASVLITGMLVFSGLGSFVSQALLPWARVIMPTVFVLIGALLIDYGLALDRVLDWVGTLAYGWRLVCCFALILPPAFLMGMPMPSAMASLARLGKEHMFLWAWGINGCFSVIGAAAVPLIATSFGLAGVLEASGIAYLVALPAFFSVLKAPRFGAVPA